MGAKLTEDPSSDSVCVPQAAPQRDHQFGLLDVADTGTALEVTASARDAHGQLVPGLELRLRCDQTGCVAR
ncbi:hypothetical protein [Luteitalea sp.]|uniref:hypothetical protein n=1 Tax=Luteitalea sp. TaxID=2004800 RepID=UPI0025C1E67F|nr:hypothetical protein [Luteitalea sp.]